MEEVAEKGEDAASFDHQSSCFVEGVAQFSCLTFISGMRFLILVLALALFGIGWHVNVLGSVGTWWRQQGADALKTSDLEKNLSARLTAAWPQTGGSELLLDARLQEWLGQRMDDAAPDMNTLTRETQEAFPEYRQVAALQTRGATEEELSSALVAWPEMADNDYTHLAVLVRPLWGNLGWQGCVIVGQRLALFTPEALAKTDESEPLFYSECPLCGRRQTCQIRRDTRSLALQCAGCERIYAMIACGSDGRHRYVNEFLEGYEPPARYPQGQSRLAELLAIWQVVSASCRYTQDTGANDEDAWQSASETHKLARGDCEDSALLLADWLLARGFEARVALGRDARRADHAWVVVRLEGEDYLLEPTGDTTGGRKAPLLSEVGSGYVPEILFDRDAIYTREDPTASWKGDFWSDETWLRIEPRSTPQ